jgi:hypothetical protein
MFKILFKFYDNPLDHSFLNSASQAPWGSHSPPGGLSSYQESLIEYICTYSQFLQGCKPKDLIQAISENATAAGETFHDSFVIIVWEHFIAYYMCKMVVSYSGPWCHHSG